MKITQILMNKLKKAKMYGINLDLCQFLHHIFLHHILRMTFQETFCDILLY